MSFAVRKPDRQESSRSIDDVADTETAPEADLPKKLHGREAARDVLGYVALMSPVLLGIGVTHELHPGTVPESVAASAGFLLTSAVIIKRRYY